MVWKKNVFLFFLEMKQFAQEYFCISSIVCVTNIVLLQEKVAKKSGKEELF